jgi:polysaccharide biosynthesis protein PslA
MFLAEETTQQHASATDQPVIGRAVVCSVVGLVEGAAAAAILFGVALGYHLTVLRIAPQNFDLLFYGAFSLLAGSVYASFSAAACSRFLDGERRREWAVSTSLFSWTAALAIALLVAFIAGNVGYVSRVTLTVAYVAGVLLLPMSRRFMQAEIARRIGAGRLHFEKIALIGRRPDVSSFLVHGELSRKGHTLSGVLYIEDHVDARGAIDERAVIEFARENLGRGADHVVLLGDLSDLDELERLVGTLKRFALNFVYAPATRNKTLKFLNVVAIGPNNALRFTQKPMSDAAVLLKRGEDLVLSSIALVLLAPLLLLVALAILLDSPGPVMFRQARRGFNGEVFMIWKFRTMTVTESGFEMRQATAGDSRVTRIGRLLRRSSIDELPQLINVLLGQMSLVGPRPHAVSHDDELSQRVAKYAHRQRIKPGITGWAQVNGFRGETRTTEQIEGRVVHDIYYIENWSIFLDLWIMLLTLISPTTRRNAH